MIKKRTIAVTIASIATAVLLGACSSSNGKPKVTASSTGSANTTPSVASSNSASRPSSRGSAVATAMQAAMKAAPDFHVIASTGATGIQRRFDLHISVVDPSGSFVIQGRTVQIISAAPYVYARASTAFWQGYITGQFQPPYLAQLDGKWIKVHASSVSFKNLLDVFAPSNYQDQALSDPPSMYTYVGQAKLGSIEVLELQDNADDATVDVAAAGTPYPVRVSLGQGASGSIATFSGWNQRYVPTLPPAAQLVDLTSSGQ
jgi:hypothetical protein